MNSPIDVAKFSAAVIAGSSFSESKKIFELVGPQKYSSTEVAETFSHLLSKNIEPQPIPKEKWQETLLSVGFTRNTASNLSDMTKAVVEGNAVLENEDKAIKLQTGLYKYLEERLKDG